MKIILLALILTSTSCASRKFKKDYEVTDASSKEIPKWLEEPQDWASDEDEKDAQAYQYYVYNSDPKTSRSIACKIAKANAANEVASEISQFINNSFAQTVSGDASDKKDSMTEYVEDRLGKEVQQHVVGAKIHRTYWEKRSFKKDMGHKQDWDGYTCSVLLKISKENLSQAFDRAEKKLLKETKKESKEKVKEIIEETKKEFLL